MNINFVPKDIAVILSEKGFPETSIMFESAPLYQNVIEWFCDVHNIEIDVLRYTYSGGKWMGKCYMWAVDQFDPKYNDELEENDAYWILNERKSQGFEYKDRINAIFDGIRYALTLI